MVLSVFTIFFIPLFNCVHGLCGENIRWLHKFNVEDLYGMWYAVGHTQHNPDMSNVPNAVGCVAVHISDATGDPRANWQDFLLPQRTYIDENWKSYRSNPWSDYSISGSWLDTKVRLKKRAKRSYDSRRVRVLWDEDGQTMEQTYTYAFEDPGIWTLEQFRPGEREAMERGIELWQPDVPPKHPEVIRILRVRPELLVFNHCSEAGVGGIFTLILKRKQSPMDRWGWQYYRQQFYEWGLPKIHRHSAVCAGCGLTVSVVSLMMGVFLQWLL